MKLELYIEWNRIRRLSLKNRLEADVRKNLDSNSICLTKHQLDATYAWPAPIEDIRLLFLLFLFFFQNKKWNKNEHHRVQLLSIWAYSALIIDALISVSHARTL